MAERTRAADDFDIIRQSQARIRQSEGRLGGGDNKALSNDQLQSIAKDQPWSRALPQRPLTNDRSRCLVRDQLVANIQDCWCYHAAPDGSSLPCPPPPDPNPIPVANIDGDDDWAWVCLPAAP